MSEKKLRILCVSPYTTLEPKSGGTVIFLNRSKQLYQKGHKISFIIYKYKKDKNISETDSQYDGKILSIILKNKFLSFLKSFFSNKPYTYFRHMVTQKEKLQILNIIEQNKIDIVIFDETHTFPIYRILKKNLEMKNIKTSYFAHNIDYINT